MLLSPLDDEASRGLVLPTWPTDQFDVVRWLSLHPLSFGDVAPPTTHLSFRKITRNRLGHIYNLPNIATSSISLPMLLLGTPSGIYAPQPANPTTLTSMHALRHLQPWTGQLTAPTPQDFKLHFHLNTTVEVACSGGKLTKFVVTPSSRASDFQVMAARC